MTMTIRVRLLLTAVSLLLVGCQKDECTTDEDCCLAKISQKYRCAFRTSGNRCAAQPNDNPLCSPSSRDGGTTPGAYCDSNGIPASGVRLSVSPLAQTCSEWCWAATSTMVLNYYGLQGNECYAVDPSGACCSPYACQSNCNMPGRPDVVLNYFGVHSQQVIGALSEPQLQHELANGRPVIAQFISSSISHFVLLSGFVPAGPNHPLATYHLIDPINWSQPWQAGVTPYVGDLTYAQVYAGPDGQSPWRVTYALLTPRADGCSPPFNPGCVCRP